MWLMSRGNNVPCTPDVGGYVRYISHHYYHVIIKHDSTIGCLIFLNHTTRNKLHA